MDTLLVIQTAALASKRRLNLGGIARAADELGWRVQTIEAAPTQPTLDRLIRFWNPCGLVLECSCCTTAYKVPRGLPTVFIDRDPALCSAPCVRNDSTFIAELVAREFLSLGLRHFAFVGWHRNIYWCEEKLDAYARILALHGAAFAAFRPTPREASDQIRLQKRLRAWLKELPTPCGVFAINDNIAEHVLAAAFAEGISVPGQLAVIGVDNDESICERTRPTLTSVMPNFSETGYRAVHMLAARPPKAARLVIPPLSLVRRQSTRLLRRADPHVNAALELIRREACSGLFARDVFRLFPCSRRLAERKFLEATGESVLKAIQRTRLERAEQLLKDPHIPVKTVANLCGWNSDVIFRRIFTAAFGTPPKRLSRTGD